MDKDIVTLADLVNIEGMAWFKTGKHNGIPFSDDDLDEIVKHFKVLKGQIRPKLKITHKETQSTLAGLASYGDITNVFSRIVTEVIDGVTSKVKTLFVDIANVPSQVKDWIKDRRFPERSGEIWTRIDVGGKVFKNVLRNVSLLGHEAPAVPGLEPVKAQDQDGEFVCIAMNFTGDEEIVLATEEPKPDEGGENTVETKEMGEKLEAKIEAIETEKVEMAEKIAKLENQSDAEKAEKTRVALKEEAVKLEQVQKEADENKAAKDELATLKAQNRKDDIASKVESWKKDGHLLPKEEAIATALMESFEDKVIKLSVPNGDDQKDIESTQADLLDALLKERKLSSFEEITVTGDGDVDDKKKAGSTNLVADLKVFEKDGTKVPVGFEGDAELEEKIAKYQKDNEGVSYGDAMIAVG